MNRKTKTKRDILSIIDYALKETSIEKAIRSSVKLNGNILKIKKKLNLCGMTIKAIDF